MLTTTNADMEGGCIVIKPERERFDGCTFRRVQLFVNNQPGAPIFTRCKFEECHFGPGAPAHLFHECIFLPAIRARTP